MEKNIPGADITYTAEVAIAEGLGFVKGSSAGAVALPAADGERPKGFAVYGVAAAEAITARKMGKAKIVNSGAFAEDDELILEAATGKLKKYVPNYGGGIVYIAAIADEAAAADDVEGYAWLTCYARNDTIYHAAAADPGVNNDGVDTATLGATFQVGALWLNETDGGLFRCSDNSTGAAVWAEVTIA